jgi:hypothetical protein
MVGRKNARPWTVMLSSKKMKAVARVTGLKIPFRILGTSSLSRTSVDPTRSDLIRAIARSFSSCVSHLAVAGRSVKVKKAIRDRPMVMMPSIA